jgi:Zn-finger nucleic acid-binding protein
VLIDRCPRCGWEGVWLPGGGVMCAEHGIFDEAGNLEREARRIAEAARIGAEWMALLLADDYPWPH